MSMHDRAAQFSPFAALTGYDAAIKQAGRLTCERVELSEDARAELDVRQAYLMEMISEQPALTVTYFLPNAQRPGGEYLTASGNLKRIDTYERTLVFTDGRKIPLDDIAEIESELFNGML